MLMAIGLNDHSCLRHRKSGLIGGSWSPSSSHGWTSGSGSPTLRIECEESLLELVPRRRRSDPVLIERASQAPGRAPSAGVACQLVHEEVEVDQLFGLGRVEDSLEATPA